MVEDTDIKRLSMAWALGPPTGASEEAGGRGGAKEEDEEEDGSEGDDDAEEEEEEEFPASLAPFDMSSAVIRSLSTIPLAHMFEVVEIEEV